MKINAFRDNDPKWSADLWTFVQVTGPDGANKNTYSFNRRINFTVVSGAMGKLDAHFSEDEADVRQLCQLYNFNTPTGVEVETAGVWQVQLISPWINMWGVREGFRVRLQMVGVDA